MEWIRIPLAFLILLVGAFASSFLTSVWERRKRRNPEVDRLLAILPGHDCGLCGVPTCRSYARVLSEGNGDPALCAPGGQGVERALREALGGKREYPLRAVVRCGGSTELNDPLFQYDGAADCHAATMLYGGPKSCLDACIGLGSCIKACPLGAIRLAGGLAVVDPDRCTGCGACLEVCPTGVIALAPADALWYVACNSRRKAEEKLAACRVPCTGCAECVRRSASWEFSLEGNLAKASTTQGEGGEERFADCAEGCPTGAIVKAGEEKKASSPS